MQDMGAAANSTSTGSISTSLLARIKDRQPQAWERLVDVLGPAVYRWCRRAGVAADDAGDLVQEVFAAVAAHVEGFRRDRAGGGFCSWLWTITRNKVYDHFRRCQGRPEAAGGTTAQQQFLQVPQPLSSAPPATEPAEGGLLSRQAVEAVRAEFEDRTWEAFRLVVAEGRSPADVAADLGMTLPAVYKAKSRVLRRLRQELGDLLE